MIEKIGPAGKKIAAVGALLGSTLALSACVVDPGYYGPPGYYGEPGYHHGHHHRRGDYYRDRDDNPPGPRGGRGTNWENPPGPRGGPGASPDRRYWR